MVCGLELRCASKWFPPSSDSVFKLNLALSQSWSKSSVGVGFLIRNSKGEVMAALCEWTRNELHSLWTAATVMGMALVFCQNTCFSNVIFESNFSELVDFLNSDRICSLEVAWILEDVKLICEQFVCMSFVSIPLRCNRATLVLASIAKESEEVIVCLVRRIPLISFPYCTTWYWMDKVYYHFLLKKKKKRLQVSITGLSNFKNEWY